MTAPDEQAIQLLALATRLATEAGRMVFTARQSGTGLSDTKSSATDIVTEFDRASEALIVGQIDSLRPDDGIVGEEGSSRHGTSGFTWFIDPIDGTTNFFYNLTGYAVSIGIADTKGMLVAAVYLPVTDELFTAIRGAGALCNGQSIRCSITTELAQSLVGTGFSYHPHKRVLQAERLVKLIGQLRDIRRFGAASADLCYVAAGRLDAYFEENLGPWDIAAGCLIATEAGCISTDFSGSDASTAQVLVAAPGIHHELLQLINHADAARTAPR